MAGNGTVALSGDDTFILNNRVFNNLATGTCIELKFPNNVANVKTGKNGNAIYSLNETGKQCESVVRVIRGSLDDKFLNNLFSQQQANFAGTALYQGQFIKKIGDGAGNITSDTYILGGGLIQKEPEAKTNVEGETEQSITEWHFIFSNAPRTLT